MISAKNLPAAGITRLVLLAAAACLFPAGGSAQSSDELPDAPQAAPQQTSLGSASAQQNPASGLQSAPTANSPVQSQNPAPQTSGTSSSSQSSSPATQNAGSGNTQPGQNTPETKEQREERAKRELQEQEKQRMLGIVPMFNVQSNANAAPLTSKQKFQLFFRSSTDWYQFAITAIDGGLSMAGNEYASYGQGVEGFAKYWGAAYADTFDGNLWGNAILTSWWKEDPRYYRMGHGPFVKRVAYSAVTTVWCKRDKGTWGPNYANVSGNFIGGTISNLYYPKNDRGVGLTLGRGASVTYEGIVGAEIAEFWPDIIGHFNKKHQEKLAAQAAKQGGSTATTKAAPQGTAVPPPDNTETKPQ